MNIGSLKLINVASGDFLKKYKTWILLLLLFIIHLFLRFYQLEARFSLGTDQLESSWAAKRIIVDHIFPLLGPANKVSSGIYTGPLYFYLITPFYLLTNLDPIAGAIFAGVTSIFSFFAIFYIVKKLFSFNTYLVALFINIISFSGIQFDRMQWEINFIPLVALIGFYALYKILHGKEIYVFPLAFAIGFAFHIHITVAVFLPIITLLVLPFFPKTKKMLKYSVLSFLIFLFLFFPLVLANLQTKNAFSGHVFQYIGSSYHGFHLTRFIQLTSAAFIQIESFLAFSWLKPLNLLALPLFLIIYYFKKPSKDSLIFCYLVTLFFIVPWLVLSTYSGQITDYYFSTNRFIALFIVAYLVMQLLKQKQIILTTLIAIFATYYSFINLRNFLILRVQGLRAHKLYVKAIIKEGKVIQFKEGAPQSYLYYIYTKKK